jgi:hypothetical protein
MAEEEGKGVNSQIFAWRMVKKGGARLPALNDGPTAVVWTSLGPVPRWVPGPTTRWAPGTTRLVPHDT